MQAINCHLHDYNIATKSAQLIVNKGFYMRSGLELRIKAETSICLGPGFHATAGSAATTFHAVISSTPPDPVTPSVTEYIRLGQRVIAIENTPQK
jgi:hypothetical protein